MTGDCRPLRAERQGRDTGAECVALGIRLLGGKERKLTGNRRIETWYCHFVDYP